MRYDLTAEISSDLVAFPGDPRYCTEIVSSLEGLERKDIQESRYDSFVVPLNIPDMDGLPAQVFAKIG